MALLCVYHSLAKFKSLVSKKVSTYIQKINAFAVLNTLSESLGSIEEHAIKGLPHIFFTYSVMSRYQTKHDEYNI